MGAQNSVENLSITADLKSAIERLRVEFQNLRFGACHSFVFNYDNFDADVTEHFEELSCQYQMGITFCDKILNGRITLQEFCQKIIVCEMKSFLFKIAEFLPIEYIEMYGLIADGDKQRKAEEENMLGKMGTYYAAECSSITVGLKSAIERMRVEFQNLRLDAQHSYLLNHNLYDDDAHKHFDELSCQYGMGVTFCDKILNEHITLREFCQKIIACEMKSFLFNIAEFLPEKYIEMYGLIADGDKQRKAEEENMLSDV